MILLFEDHPDMPISRFIANNIQAEFVERNVNLSARALELRKTQPQEQIIIFLDFVVNNTETIDLYGELITTFVEDNNVRIIPIPCIEFIALCCLNSLNLLENNVFKSIIIKLMNNTINSLAKSDITMILSDKSLEKFCKRVLNQQRPYCKRNKRGKVIEGHFYLKDCLCNNDDETRCITVSLADKWHNFYRYLDFTNISNFNHNKNDIFTEAVEYYNSLSEQLGLDRTFILII